MVYVHVVCVCMECGVSVCTNKVMCVHGVCVHEMCMQCVCVVCIHVCLWVHAHDVCACGESVCMYTCSVYAWECESARMCARIHAHVCLEFEYMFLGLSVHMN